MKIAICLSGMPRNIDNSYQWLSEFLLSVLRKNNIVYDIFMSLWEDSDVIASKVRDLFRPKKICFEPWDDDKIRSLGWQRMRKFDNADKPNFLGMYYQIHKCNQLKKHYEQTENFVYDAVFRVRTELRFQAPLSIEELEFVTKSKVDKRIFLPLIPNGQSTWTRDIFAFGSSNTMDIYSDIYNHLFDLNNKVKSSTPEVLLREWLYSNKLETHHTIMNPLITRT